MISIEKCNIIDEMNIFSTHGDVDDVSVGYKFNYDGFCYEVESVAMIKSVDMRVRNDDVEVVAKIVKV